MGQSTFGCCPRARSLALRPRQFPISNVCRTRMIYDDSTAVMSFPATIYVDNRGSGLPDSLDTSEALERYGQVSQKIEALIAKDAKDGDIQSVIMEVPGILLKCVDRDEAALAVAQKVFNSLYDNASTSGRIMWYVAALVAIRDVCKLVVKELTNWVIYLDDEKKFNIEIIFRLIRSELLNVGVYNVHLAKLFEGGRNKVATEFAGSLVQKLITQDSSISELCDVADALSKIEALVAKDGEDGEIQVLSSQTNKEETSVNDTTPADSIAFQDKVSGNPSVVGGCWKSSCMGLLRFSTRLQPRHYRPSSVRGTPSKKFKKSIKRLNTNIFQSNLLLKYKERINLLQQELKNSINLIATEQYKISLIHNVQKSRSIFDEKIDKIMSMEMSCKENDKLLKKIQTGLLLNFDRNDSLLSEVKKIHTDYKAVSKKASRLASQVYDYGGRVNVEFSWLSKFVNTMKVFSSKFSAINTDIEDFRSYLLELSQSIDDIASWDSSSHDYMSHLYTLRKTFRIWESTNLSIKYSAILLEHAADICLLAKNWRSIYCEKTDLAERFEHAEIDVEQNCPKVEEAICRLEREVDRVNKLYLKKLSDIPKDEQRFDTSSHTFQMVFDDLFSWRFRMYNNRYITPSIRMQGRGECSSVSTISGTESLYKKQHAATINFEGQVYQAQEFIIKLSHNHLQDIVAQFFQMKPYTGKNKLEVCLEQMVEKGVLSEPAYDDGAVAVEDSHRYRIDRFEEINEADFEEGCDRLEEGDVLIANFYITKDYYRVGPNDIYDITPGAIIETTSAGHKISHCVVIVGFGVAPDGSGYYVYQNSYGPDWGKGGYGRISSRSLKYLYSKTSLEVSMSVGTRDC